MASYPADFIGMWETNQVVWSPMDTNAFRVLDYDRDRFSVSFSRSTSGGSAVTVRPTSAHGVALGDGFTIWEGSLVLDFAKLGGAIQEPWWVKVQSPGITVYVLEVLFRRT